MVAHHITWGNWYWPTALIIVSSVAGLLFFPAETYAFFTNTGNTLSDFSRYELGLQTAFGGSTRLHTVSWWVSFLVWDAFVIWITGHIWFLQWG